VESRQLRKWAANRSLRGVELSVPRRAKKVRGETMPRLVRSRQISMGLERSQVEMKDESSNSDCFGKQATSVCLFTRTATVFRKEQVKDIGKQMGIIVLPS
jgi:hypothetical protein